MTDATFPDAWTWQGWFGEPELAAAAKALTDADQRAGAWVPPIGAPAVAMDEDGTVVAFVVLTRAFDPIPDPPGLKRARAEVIGRMMGG